MASVKIHKVLYVLESIADVLEEEFDKVDYDVEKIENLVKIYADFNLKMWDEIQKSDHNDRENTECVEYLTKRMKKIIEFYQKLGE